jgi:molecular chaperone GrpE
MSDTPDSLPSDEELDAVLDEIERDKKGARKRRAKMSASADMEAAMDAVKDAGGIPEKPSDAEVAEARVAELETELATFKDRALRMMAEAENVKKRSEREVTNAKIYGVEKFAGDILGVFDNLQRALNSVDEKTREDLGPNAQTLLEGLELTEKTLMAALARHGITAVAGQGSKFDPNIHQAVAQIPSKEYEKGQVAEVMQTGFTLGDRTLRAAMVAVSTG